MKSANWCFLLIVIWLGAGAARAQTTCATPNPPASTFVAVDVATGLTVEAFCVGRGVRFEQYPGRNVPTNLLSYGVLPGIGTTYINATPVCYPPNRLPYTYTPTRAEVGMVTVSELANVGANATYYIRTYRVYDTPPPVFNVAPCPSGFALVTVTDAVYDSYTVQIVGTGAARPIVRNQATVLPVPAGATSVTVLGHYNASAVCEGSNSQTIAPLLPAQVPAFTRLSLAAPLPSPATLAVGQLPAGYLYSLQAVDASVTGGYRFVTSVPAGSSSVTLPGATAGCYRLRRVDPCHLDSAFSPLICTLTLTGSSARNRNQLLLNDAGAGSTTYTVTRNGTAITGFTTITGGLEDADVQCGTAYTYVVTAIQPGGGMAVSNPITITTLSALPPVQPRLLASFNLNNVVVLTPLLTTPLVSGASLRYHRAAGGVPAVAFGNVDLRGIGLRDSIALDALLASPPCYSVGLTDICGNTSPESTSTCPALLTAATTVTDPTSTTATLTWTPFTGPNPIQPATYVLQRLAADASVLSTVPVTGTSYPDLTPPTDRQVLRYRLKISGAGLPPGTFSYSNLATVTRPLSLTIPSAFTPNGDGLNDVLEVKGKYLNNYTFVVVDRNGQEVFRGTQRSETWDGSIKGHAPVLGAYVWRFQQTDENGKAFTAMGSVTILK